MKFNRFIIILPVLLGLVSCTKTKSHSKRTSSSNTGSSSTSLTTSSSSSTSLTTSSSSSTGGIAKYNFEFWTGFGKDYTYQAQDVVNKFNDKHSGDVYIKHISKGDYDGLHTAIKNNIGGETYPNLAIGYPDHFAAYWNNSILMSLDDYINRYDQENGLKAQNKSISDDYYENYMKENTGIAYDDDGTPFTVGLPFNKSTEMMICNGWYFDYFKSIDNSIVVPTTWDDLRTVSTKIITIVNSQNLLADSSRYIIGVVDPNTNKASNFRVSSFYDPTGSERVIQDITALSNENKFYTLGYDSAENAFITILKQWGIHYTEYTKADYERDMFGKAKFWSSANQAATTAAMEYFKTLNSEHAFGVPNTFKQGELFCTDFIEKGRCLFTISSSAGLLKPEICNGEGRLDVFPILYKDASHKAVISQGTSLGMLNKFKSQEEIDDDGYKAFCSMVELTTGELNATFAASTGYFPTSQSGMNHSVYKNPILDNPSTKVEKIYSNAGHININTYDAGGWEKFVDPGFVGSSSIRNAVYSALNNVFTISSISEAMNLVWNNIPDKLRG